MSFQKQLSSFVRTESRHGKFYYFISCSLNIVHDIMHICDGIIWTENEGAYLDNHSTFMEHSIHVIHFRLPRFSILNDYKMRDRSKRNKQKHRESVLNHWSIWSLMLTVCVLSVSTSQKMSCIQCFIMHNMAPDRNFYYCSICINCIVLSTNAGMNHRSVNWSSSRDTCTITIFFSKHFKHF